MFTYCRTHELTIEQGFEPVSRRKKVIFLWKAGPQATFRGKQRVHGAAQLIGLMTDDALMTAACDLFSLSACTQALCNTGSPRQQRQSYKVCFLNKLAQQHDAVLFV